MTDFLVKHFVKDCENTQHPDVRAAYGQMAGWTGVACNLLLAAGKLAAGLLSGAMAVVADAVNNLSDAAASIVTLISFRLMRKPADAKHPFGHARFEYISGLIVAVTVLFVGAELAKSAVERIIDPRPVAYSWLSFSVLGLAVLAKLWLAAFNRTVGRRIASNALEATFADSRNDAIATGAVLAAGLVSHFTGLVLDGVMSAAAAVFILLNGVGLVKQTLDPLLGQAPDPALVRHMREKIKNYPGVLGTHDLILHDYGPGRRFASAHVEMASGADVMASHDVIDTIERDFMQENRIQLIIHYDPVETDNAEVRAARAFTAAAVAGIDARLSIHDFRMVDGPEHSNYIFDVEAPPEYPLSDAELEMRVAGAVRHGKKPVYAVITVDRSYAGAGEK